MWQNLKILPPLFSKNREFGDRIFAFYFFNLHIAKKSSQKKIADLESMKLTMWKDPRNSQRKKLGCIEVSRIALRRQGDDL
jgi:hypothetical protein